MSFRCGPKTLERLEWPRLAECLAREAATGRGAEACRGNLFAPTREAAQERLAETSEMRTLLDAHDDTLRALIEDRRRLRAALVRASSELIADLLLDVAAQFPINDTTVGDGTNTSGFRFNSPAEATSKWLSFKVDYHRRELRAGFQL